MKLEIKIPYHVPEHGDTVCDEGGCHVLSRPVFTGDRLVKIELSASLVVDYSSQTTNDNNDTRVILSESNVPGAVYMDTGGRVLRLSIKRLRRVLDALSEDK